MPSPLLDFPIHLDGRLDSALHDQVYAQLRGAILDGRLKRGQKVPSTRHLSEQLSVSRSTVTLAYENLIAEGYLEPSRGSGTYVCRNLPDDASRTTAPEKEPRPSGTIQFSAFGRRIASKPADRPYPSAEINFYPWQPSFDSVPTDEWARLLTRELRSCARSDLDYAGETLGDAGLRKTLCDYLRRVRAVRCEPDQILITTGTQQAISLAARVLAEAGTPVAVEDPGYIRIKEIMGAEEAQILPVPIDDRGIRVSALKELNPVPKIVYVTPSHQYPTGSVMPVERRLELLSWAAAHNAIVFEDDYDSEYRYEGRPIPAMQGLDEHGRVLYAGTFSKTLFPSIRLGYIVAAPELIEVLARTKRITDRHCALAEQRALAHFIAEGHLDRHLRRMRVLYNERRIALVDALREHFGNSVEIAGENAGIHLMIRIRLPFNDDEALQRASNAGVTIFSARRYYWIQPRGGEFLLGYANLTPEIIREGIRRLANAFQGNSVQSEIAAQTSIASV